MESYDMKNIYGKLIKTIPNSILDKNKDRDDIKWYNKQLKEIRRRNQKLEESILQIRLNPHFENPSQWENHKEKMAVDRTWIKKHIDLETTNQKWTMGKA